MRYVAIRSEGGLIPYDLLDKIASEVAAGQKPGDFGLPKGRRLTDEISRVWADAQSLWSNFKRRRESLGDRDPYGTSITRSWIGSLLGDVDMLGFDLKLQASAVVVNNSTYAISHRSGEGEDAIPVHIEGLKIDLDRRLHTKLRTSPQAMMQDFLNNNEPTVWGIVTNGLSFRILRNSSRTSRPTYLEFDLENIFEGNRFNEFGLFYRVCHRSRFPMPGGDPGQSLLERYYLDSIEQGLRVREKLREGVEETLKILGTALLQHSENNALREKVSSRKITAVQLHRQLLLLVYRLLFLMVAEERGLIASVGENSEQNQKIYDEWYSITRLRDRAAQIIDTSPFGDVWQGLQQTFSLFEYGLDTNALGIPPLNGDLFHQEQAIPDLKNTDLCNHDLLRAIRHLSLFKDGSVQQRVNYSALDVEELGSVYESLLDYQPVLQATDRGTVFDLRTGAERKSTGSYYTRPELVQELVQSALVPVMEERLAEAEKASEGKNLLEEQKAKIGSILSMTVCDPACGSGHFLLAAARRLGKELARIRTGEDEPKPEDFHLAVRDVISHCVYGVDLNPLAVDLCKLALWLEGHWAGKPLSFLDHKIRCGNSLVGVLNADVLADGIPDDAFTAVTGDDKKVAALFKKRNKQERASKQRGLSFEPDEHSDEYAKATRELTDLAEDSAAAVRHKAELYGSWRAGMQLSHDQAADDLWTAQFFHPLINFGDPTVCTTAPFLDFATDAAKQPQRVAAAQGVAVRNHFFHWCLEFPEIFSQGGFDVVLGNPPWGKIKFKEEPFFALRVPEIANASTAAKRKTMVAELPVTHPEIAVEYALATRAAEATDKFVRNATRFPFCGCGDINTYSLFAELMLSLLSEKGRLGCVVPSGIATDATTSAFFRHLLSKRMLCSFFDFENRKGLFPDVQGNIKFCLLTLSSTPQQRFEVAAQLDDPALLRDASRRYDLTPEDIAVLNPNSLNCPTLRNKRDAEILKKVHREVPIFIRDEPKQNAWRASFLRMFDMTIDSGLFGTYEELVADGWQLQGNQFRKANEVYSPLYEAKLTGQFNHRAASFDGIPRAQRFKIHAGTTSSTESNLADSKFVSLPRYWVPEREVFTRIPRNTAGVLGFRNAISAVADSRSLVACMLPPDGVGNSMPVIVTPESPVAQCVLLAMMNSYVLDFAVRQKASGGNLNFYIFEQLPILAPETFAGKTPWDQGFTLRDWIARRALELSYTAWDLREFASGCGYDGSPFQWDAERRFHLRCELDAAMFHLYKFEGVADVEYVMNSFPVQKRIEESESGHFKSAQRILELFSLLDQARRTGKAYSITE